LTYTLFPYTTLFRSEVDEASLRHITEHIKPEVILTTNIFRDQMDRYGEIYTTYDFILQGAAKAKDAILMQNGDAPIFSSRKVDRSEEHTSELQSRFD